MFPLFPSDSYQLLNYDAIITLYNVSNTFIIKLLLLLLLLLLLKHTKKKQRLYNNASCEQSSLIVCMYSISDCPSTLATASQIQNICL